ncbi:putative major facilitator superfamily general substrate [Rosellinia necatrix]|uniref:Putative major facilitator superfamily general substrate n=1 Tax=Rosellinia necatrix TaxID=77044 RepID=A0A1W2TQF0_ROSNE|nr:putative major facilitator superfamily general substrate [Rosellinia necatrix]
MGTAKDTDSSVHQEEDIDHPTARDGGHTAEPSMTKQHGDRIMQLVGDERVVLTEEDNRRIRRQTDKVILTILVWVYFLQILDKTVLGNAATFGLIESTGLTGGQYSVLGSIAPIAQLAWQPFSSVLIVRVPHRLLMPALVLGWGIASASLAGCRNFRSLLAARFFLGLFEAGCLPLFSVITSQWYRRAEQPLRVAAWYGTNGIATIVASALSYGLGHINSPYLESWQIIFLFVGLVTVATSPFVYWKLDNDIPSARFLSEEDKPRAVERLRANQTGTAGSREFKWRQVLEILIEPKTYLWIALSLFINAGASVTNTFGPLILNGLGFDKYTTSLLNIPFGFAQWVIILLASWLTQRFRLKAPVVVAFVLPVIAGLAVLYTVPRTPGHSAPLLVGYYLLAFLFGTIPVKVAWIVANTAGTTKKSTIMSVYNAAASTGNIVGPIVFNSRDAPSYIPGLRTVLAFFVATAAAAVLQAANLALLNKQQERRRVRNGKPAKIKDASMADTYEDIASSAAGDEEASGGVGDGTATTTTTTNTTAAAAAAGRSRLGQNAFADMTDRENDEFVYVL